MSTRKQLIVDTDKDIDSDTLPLWRKLCFAVGGAPYQITSTVIGFFLNLFLLEVALLEPRYVSIILFSGKAWDAITDPSIGILVQRTNTRWGKMRPWIILSAPFACAAYLLLFYLPFDVVQDPLGHEVIQADQGTKFAFYFAMFCLFEGFLTCLHVPYTALTMYITTNQKDRDTVTFIRMGFETLGVLIAVLVQGVFVSDTRCNGDEPISRNKTSLIVQRDAYLHGSLVVIAIYMVCCVTVFFGTKEKQGIIEENKDSHLGFFQGIKLVFSFKPYLWASLTFLFWTIGIQIVQTNMALFVTHVLQRGDEFPKLIFCLLVVSIVAMPLWHLLALKFGKKRIYAAGIILCLPVFTCNLFLPSDLHIWIYYVIMVSAGMAISVALLLPWSVLPDVLDLYMLEKRVRHDALFYSFYVFFNKLAGGVALAFSQMALDVGGYVSGQCQQPESVDQTLRLLMTPGPVVASLLALLALFMYPIDEETRSYIKNTVGSFAIKVDSREPLTESVKSYESLRQEVQTEM